MFKVHLNHYSSIGLTLFFVTLQDLKDYMRQAGEVTYADAHKPRRNEGCVEFASERVSFSTFIIKLI